MRVLYEAALAGGEAKMDATLKARKSVFAAFARDAQSQLAQLIAMEHLLGVAAPGEGGHGGRGWTAASRAPHCAPSPRRGGRPDVAVLASRSLPHFPRPASLPGLACGPQSGSRRAPTC
jgi:hypothetical protein